MRPVCSICGCHTPAMFFGGRQYRCADHAPKQWRKLRQAELRELMKVREPQLRQKVLL